MARDIMRLTDPERIAIRNRLGKTIRWLGEHTIPKDFLVATYGSDNEILALLDDDPNKEVTLIEAISLGIFNRAMKGDVRAAEFIRDTIGEKPATNINVSTDSSTTLSSMTTEQLMRLAAIKGAVEAEPVPAKEGTKTAEIGDPFEEEPHEPDR